MGAGVFTITELRNAIDPSQADEGERFEWTSDSRPLRDFDGTRGGGARACPVKPWAIQAEQRNIKTNYPNAVTPSRQVMGPTFGMQTFKGRWDDRYNGAGYAIAEMRRFENMCMRGNLVRIAYGPIVFEGMLAQWTFDVQRLWDIDYEFVFDPDGKPEQKDTIRVPQTPASPAALLDRFDVAVQALLDADTRAPRHLITGTLADDVTTNLVAATVARQGIADTIDVRDLRPSEHSSDGFTRIATQFRAGRSAAYNLLLILSSVRADVNMATRTPLGVLDFEDWTRSLRFTARVAMGAGFSGDRAATERAEPDAVRLYRPAAGEHLYAIARKFYGNAFAYRLIYERNSLRTFIMSGSEVLIIPERGGV